MRPPCRAACCATRASPRPEPPAAAVLPRRNRPSTVSCSSAGSPRPLSSTMIVIVWSWRCAFRHDAGGLTVGDRVAHQVVHGQPQPARPTPDGADVFDLHDDLHRAAGPHVLAGHPVQHVGDVDDFTVFDLRELARRQLTQCGDDRLHPALRTRQVLHHLVELVGGQVVDSQRVQVGAHRGERGAQFVSCVGSEVLGGLQRVRGGLLRGRQPAQHRAHRLGEVLGLADTAHFGHVVAALAQPLGVLGQSAQRADRGAGQQPAQARGEQHGDQTHCCVQRNPGGAEQDAVGANADRHQHARPPVDGDGAHPVLHAVDFDRVGARRPASATGSRAGTPPAGGRGPARRQHSAASDPAAARDTCWRRRSNRAADPVAPHRYSPAPPTSGW